PYQQELAEFDIDENTYAELLVFIDEWEHNPPVYFVPANDCVTFVYRVCKIAGIKYNSFALFPTSAIREIRRLNAD
ncbi:MAG: hypothetical protein LBN21_05205, partial [Treponema sp.]|nr:hypothetical protein [Treponema sp.]